MKISEVFAYAQMGVQVEIDRLNRGIKEGLSKHPMKDRRTIQQLKKRQLSYQRAEIIIKQGHCNIYE